MPDNPTPEQPKHSEEAAQQTGGLAGFWAELRRRHVVRVATVYLVVGWLVIQVANATFEDFGIPIWAYRFVVLMVALGFPISVVVAWAFELTPQGIKTTKAAKKQKAEEPPPEKFTRKRAIIAYAIGAAAPTAIFSILAVFFYFKSGEEAEAAIEDKSIAVLPFDNRSELKSDEFFTDGIHDDLLTQISRIRDIRTLARTSVEAYKDTTKRMKVIGEELGVKWLLEGGVQRGGNSIRINVQLIDPANEGHIWAETYTRELTAENIFEIQSEIAMRIADELKAVLSPEEQKQLNKLPTQNLAAMEAYFRGKEHHQKRSASGLREAVSHYQIAVSLDPNFAQAHAMLGAALVESAFYAGLPLVEQIAVAESHINRALELNNSLSEAYLAMGRLKGAQGDNQESERAYKKAIQVNPNSAEAYYRYAVFMRPRDAGEYDRALKIYNELEPNREIAEERLTSSLIVSGQLQEALKIRETRARENPRSARFQISLGDLLLYHLGRLDEAIVAYRRAHALDPKNIIVVEKITHSYSILGDTESARWWGNRASNLTKDPHLKARALKHAGDNEARFEEALGGINEDPESPWLLWHLTECFLKFNQPEKALPYWEKAYPSLFQPNAQVNGNNVYQAKDVARVLRAIGKREQSDYLLSAALKVGGTRLQEILINAVREDEERVLYSVRLYMKAGGAWPRLLWQDELEPYLGKPEYKELIPWNENDLSVQLKRIHEMEAAGAFPPIPPLPEI